MTQAASSSRALERLGEPGSPNPYLLKRRLRLALTAARVAANLTQADVVEALRFSKSKINRIEAGKIGVSFTDVQAMASLYGIAEDRLSDLEALWSHLRSGRRPLDVFRPWASEADLEFFGYEASASTIFSCQTVFLPGLLQTPAYSDALLRHTFEIDDEDLPHFLELRRLRQRWAFGKSSRKVFVIDEAVLLRGILSGKDQEAQLNHLIDVSRDPNVEIGVLPISRKPDVSLRGSLICLLFSGEEDPPLTYLEVPYGVSTTIDGDLSFSERLAALGRNAQSLEQFLSSESPLGVTT